MLTSPFQKNKWLRRLVLWLVWILGVVFLLPLNVFSSVQRWGIDMSMIDDSWTLNIPWRLHYGEVAGRDFVYTYGPLWQVLHAMGLWMPRGDAASLYRFQPVLECVLVAASIWGLLAFTGANLRWRSGLFLAWTIFLAPVEHLYIGLRPHGALFILAACGYLALQDPEVSPRKARAAYPLWFGTGPAFFLYSFDSGIYGTAALLGLAWSLSPISRRRGNPFKALRRRVLGLVGTLLAGLAVFALAVRVLPGWEHYFTDSWQVASGYAAVMALGGSVRAYAAMALAVGLLFGAIWWFARQAAKLWSIRPDEAARYGAFLGYAWFALFTVRGGITRSDEAHVVLACIPVIFLLCVLAPAHGKGLGRRTAPFWALSFIPFWLLLPTLVPGARDFSVESLRRAVVETPVAMLSKLAAAPRVQLSPATLNITNEYILDGVETARRSKAKWFYAWPNFGLLNVVADKPSPDYTVQTYSAHTAGLEERTITQLRAANDTAVYFPGYDAGLNGVQSLTRNSLVFRYLLENFETSYVSPGGSALLTRRQPGREVRWREEPLNIAGFDFDPGSGKAATLALSGGEPLCRYSDFLVLYLRCPSSKWLSVAKPGRVSIGFRMPGAPSGQDLFQRLALPPDGQPHPIIVSPRTVGDPGFLEVFAPKPSIGSGLPVTMAGLIWEPLDALSIRPSSIRVERVCRLVPEG